MLPSFGKAQVKKHSSQAVRMQGINLTDQYADGQLEACKGIDTSRFPYITTTDELEAIDTQLPEGVNPVSMFAWEKLFIVTDEPGEKGYKCYYGGSYCGDAVNLELPKQYAVVNSKLVMWPDKIYFNLYEDEMSAHPLTTAPLLGTISSGTVQFRKAVQ